MTGLECLKEELLKRGFTKAQTESKIMLGVLDILANAGGRYNDLDKLDKEKAEVLKQIAQLKQACAQCESQLSTLRRDKETLIKQINSCADKRYGEAKQYIDAFMKALGECETPQGRDTLKAAQMFINSVSVDTKYDNTAYIIGLASILSQGNTGAIDQLHKINPKVPKFPVQEHYRIAGRGKTEAGYSVTEKDPDDDDDDKGVVLRI